MLLIFRKALWRNPLGLFFQFGEKYDDVIFTSNHVFYLAVPYPTVVYLTCFKSSRNS